MKNSIIDIANRNETFQRVNDRTEALSQGFYALAQDYGFHVEGIIGNGNRHKIFDLRDNTIYRLFSATFHFQLLLRQHYIIEQRFLEIFQKDSSKILADVYPKNPNFEYAEKETASLLDSIIYHLSSVYDYISILINFICVKDRDKTPKWSNLQNTARNNPKEINSKEVVELISRLSNEFINKLYEHRSELIHKKGNLHENSTILKIKSQTETEFIVRFICSDKLRKQFKEFGEKDLDYTISYFSEWLINKTMETVAEILIALKKSMETTSNFPNFVFDPKASNALFLGYADPETNSLKSPSIMFWQIFGKHFKL